jgi:small subunit ribosomal protein S6
MRDSANRRMRRLELPLTPAVIARPARLCRRMTLPAPTYDLVLLLDPQAEEALRTKILADTRAAIAAAGEVVREDDWGDRALAYPIERHADAEYRLLQFHASSPELLHELDRTLRITDGILRFRIIKLAPGTPDAPDMRAGASAVAAHPPRQAEAQDAPPPPAEAPPEVAVGEPA